ncbi:hypothetical protein Nham_3013 [Nitrobacter hamburgensis X14]|uniref:Uncharacterized protein n=1 Tax=Nitrobacter hamburgensis (strain DSM 10229 / NCIMB 13809 / X14) TaxID=323097 RepID=Q1QJ34_NITHX|nr:hypothetical protein [Nitrobacter hamburgensis]ABE63763.1 hypothetical protein Nham_3013 [Nitrobacter hamburgensis X14]
MSLETNLKHQPEAYEDRRKFLATCGKFAIVTPPAITLLLSTSLHSQAIAMSGGKGRYNDHGNNGYGNGGGDNSPNGKEDDDR